MGGSILGDDDYVVTSLSTLSSNADGSSTVAELTLRNRERLQIEFETGAIRDFAEAVFESRHLSRHAPDAAVNMAYAPSAVRLRPTPDAGRFVLELERSDGSRSLFDFPFAVAPELSRQLDALIARHRPDLATTGD